MKKRPSTRARIDWGAARAYYVAMDPPRTFPAVAARFGVSDTAVRKHANADNWRELALEADRRAAEKALELAGKTREQRAAQTLRIFDRVSDLVEAGLTPDKEGVVTLAIDQVFSKFPDLHRIYRLETEQATDHVALAEVQAGFRAAIKVAREIVALLAEELLEPAAAAAFLRAFWERYLPAVNEALSLGAAEAGSGVATAQGGR